MKRLVLLCILFGLVTTHTAFAFESTWVDQYGETVYTIFGPDVADIGETVVIVVTVEDLTYPDAMVAATWSFLEDDVVVDSGFSVFLSGTTWERSFEFVYDEVGDHTYLFTAQDLGHGGGAHGWEWFEISGSTSVQVPTATETISWGRIRASYR